MNLPTYTLDSLLVKACETEDISQMRALLDQGASANATNEFHEPVLVLAAGKGGACICDLLLRRGADPAATDKSGWTALHRAANYGEVDVCRVLLAHGVSVEQRTPNDQTALHIGAVAIAGEAVGVCSLLLHHGANVDEPDKDSMTPLFRAASRGRVDTAELLLKYGARPDAATRTGQTPMGVARQVSSPSAMHLLRAYGATPPSDLVIMKKMTMRQAAARGGFAGRLMDLIESSAPEGEGDDIASLRELAQVKQHHAIVALLDSLQARQAMAEIAKHRVVTSP